MRAHKNRLNFSEEVNVWKRNENINLNSSIRLNSLQFYLGTLIHPSREHVNRIIQSFKAGTFEQEVEWYWGGFSI